MCPLCISDKFIHFGEDKFRSYLRCLRCHLVYVEDNYILSREEEKAVYDFHENNINDPGYRKFLSRLTDPLDLLLRPSSHGLDFGCGPGPALADILQKKGYTVDLYDLFYFPDKSNLKDKYDFITCTEVVEHIKDSNALFEYFSNHLGKDGLLGIMTKLVIDKEAFVSWHYKNDLTHIRFYSKETFRWIAQKWNWDVTFYQNDVIILKEKTI